MPGDIIIREGLLGEDMYIIGDGEVQVSLPDGQKVAVLARGAFFGEMALLSNDQLRHSRVESITICDIYSLRQVKTSPRHPRATSTPPPGSLYSCIPLPPRNARCNMMGPDGNDPRR